MKFQMSLIGDYGNFFKYAVDKDMFSGSLTMDVECFGTPDGSDVPDVIEVEITLPKSKESEKE